MSYRAYFKEVEKVRQRKQIEKKRNFLLNNIEDFIFYILLILIIMLVKV